MRWRRPSLFIFCSGLAMLLACPAPGHPLPLAEVAATFQADGVYEVAVEGDVGAYIMEGTTYHLTPQEQEHLRTMPIAELESLLNKGRERFVSGLAVRIDGRPAPTPEVVFPTAANLRAAMGEVGILGAEPVIIRGQAPADAMAMTFRFPADIDKVHLTLGFAGAAVKSHQILRSGQESWPFIIRPLAPPLEPAWHQVAARYFVLGFEHILPLGLDHVLFVIGLFLLSPRLRPLLWQVTAFTLAHSVTLALSIFNVVRLPPAIVEPLIAFSIAFVALENLWTSELKPWRVAGVFLFGLIHGLGFAGVLGELGLPPSDMITALVMFNLGVEGGQLCVILLAFLAVGWFRDRPWYRKAVVIPASVLIGAVGVFWTCQRIWTAG